MLEPEPAIAFPREAALAEEHGHARRRDAVRAPEPTERSLL